MFLKIRKFLKTSKLTKGLIKLNNLYILKLYIKFKTIILVWRKVFKNLQFFN